MYAFLTCRTATHSWTRDDLSGRADKNIARYAACLRQLCVDLPLCEAVYGIFNCMDPLVMSSSSCKWLFSQTCVMILHYVEVEWYWYYASSSSQCLSFVCREYFVNYLASSVRMSCLIWELMLYRRVEWGTAAGTSHWWCDESCRVVNLSTAWQWIKDRWLVIHNSLF